MKCLELRHKYGVNVRFLYDCLLRLAFSILQSHHLKQIVGFDVPRYVHVKREAQPNSGGMVYPYRATRWR